MADFDEPTIDTAYTLYSQVIREAIGTVALWFDGTSDSNIPTGAKGWDATNRRFMEYSGSAWGALLDMSNASIPYNIRVAVANSADVADSVDGADVDTSTNPVGRATLALNLDVSGTPRAGSWFMPISEASEPRNWTGVLGSGVAQSTCRAAIDAPSTSDMNTAIAAAVADGVSDAEDYADSLAAHGAWGAPTFTLNGNWSLYSGSYYEPLASRLIDNGNTLEIIGAITSASSGNTSVVGYYSGRLGSMPTTLRALVQAADITTIPYDQVVNFYLSYTGTNTELRCLGTAYNSITCVFNVRIPLDRPT